MIEKLLLSLLAGAVQNPQIREFFLGLARELGETLADKLLPELIQDLLPKLAALTLENLDEFAAGIATKILNSDPDLPGVSEYFDLSELLRKFLG